jgi:hypothetical protein
MDCFVLVLKRPADVGVADYRVHAFFLRDLIDRYPSHCLRERVATLLHLDGARRLKRRLFKSTALGRRASHQARQRRSRKANGGTYAAIFSILTALVMTFQLAIFLGTFDSNQ